MEVLKFLPGVPPEEEDTCTCRISRQRIGNMEKNRM